jgi:hypothetical protein
MPIMRCPSPYINALIPLLLAMTPPVLAAEHDRLNVPYPVDWRGVPLRAVLDSLSKDLETPYVVDAAVPAEAMDQRLRLFAARLTGGQAFRWAARLGGLAAVVRDGAVLIAPPASLPRLWRLVAELPSTGPAEQERLLAIDQARASITWIDAPLSSIGRDVSANLGIDMIFHPRVLAQEGLVHLEASQASLNTIRQALEEQLKTRTQIYDGALWVVPDDLPADTPATRPSAGDVSLPLADRPAAGVGPLDQFVILDESVADWPAFSGRLSRAAGVPCRVTPGVGVFGVPWQARGAAGEVLEAARLLGRLSWELLSTDQNGTRVIEIRPGRPEVQ